MIDLHSHTNYSDGDLDPADLVARAVDLGLEALAITDHDTLEGFDVAVDVARSAGLPLICGVELSTRPAPGVTGEAPGKRAPSVHVLGYFLDNSPSQKFRDGLVEMQRSRRERNTRLVEKLQSLGVEVTMAEVKALSRHQTARPHFAQALLAKGYVKTMQEAFDKYLADGASASVAREEPELEEGIARIREGGGIASLAHPVRLPCGQDADKLDALVKQLTDSGLDGIEVYHSEHSAEDCQRFLAIGRKYGLKITGGSDFHGEKAKPGISLGTGRNNLAVPVDLLNELRASVTR